MEPLEPVADMGPSNRLVSAYGLYYLDNRPIVLRAAELPYFRVPAVQWETSIAKLHDAGCNAISSSIPWTVHEWELGRLDFAGRFDAQSNLLRFLELVERAGMIFLARPGPFMCAESEFFGYPGWLADEIRDALARRPNGVEEQTLHYDVYSLLHPAHLAQVERWCAAVAGAIRPYLNAPVVTWQLDSETGVTFVNAIGRLDFNPDTVARYRTFLEERYETADLVARAWRRPVEAFSTIDPPRDTLSTGELADWQAFLERWVGTYLEVLGRIVRRQGITLPLVVNESAGYVSPQNPRVKAPAADLYGYDSYAKASGSAHTADFPFAGSLHPLRFQQFTTDERPLSCWELGTGRWDPRARVATRTTLQGLAAGVAHGLKAYNLYVAQDSDRYQFGTLLDAAGQPTPCFDVVGRFHEFVAAHEEELTASVEVHDPIAYLDYQPYTRLTPVDHLHLPGARALPDPLRYFAGRGLAGLHAVLLTAGYNPIVVDLVSATEESLADYLVAIFPSRGYLDLENYGKLVVFTLRGGHLVTFPEPVTRQQDGTPFRTAFLWPVRPARRRWLDRGRMLFHLAMRWALPYHLRTRRRLTRALPGALHLSDLFEAVLAGQAAPLRGIRLHTAGGTVRGDYQLVEFPEAGGSDASGGGIPAKDAAGVATGHSAASNAGAASVPNPFDRSNPSPSAVRAEVLLRHGSRPAGYRVPVRDGVSTLLGTFLGGSFVTSRYYALTAAERRALRQFAVSLVEPSVTRQIVPDDDLEVEAIARLSPDGGCLLFVINRLGRQQGAIHFPNPSALNLGEPLRAEALFSGAGSSADATGNGLRVRLEPDDVLIARLR
ncbi:MAG: beta-galactosidase [Chloroflexi bacterium]|nr:beta-galactosidase [Chloroflexota bacterium]